MCACVCMCVHACVYIDACMYVCVHVNSCLCHGVCACVCVYMYACVYVCTCGQRGITTALNQMPIPQFNLTSRYKLFWFQLSASNNVTSIHSKRSQQLSKCFLIKLINDCQLPQIDHYNCISMTDGKYVSCVSDFPSLITPHGS